MGLLGSIDGSVVGIPLGIKDGILVGCIVGYPVGLLGSIDGSDVGFPEGVVAKMELMFVRQRNIEKYLRAEKIFLFILN